MTLRPETLAAQALHTIDPATGAVVPPIHLATTYARDAAYQRIDPGTPASAGAPSPRPGTPAPPPRPGYTRDENPTPVHAERVVAALEGGVAALAFSSGMAAATGVFRALCKPGDHVIGPTVGYYALRGWLGRFCARWGVACDAVDTTDLAAVRAAIRPGVTRIVWVETPANPTWDVTDLAAVAEVAHAAGALLAVDSTCATPVHTQPLAHGADLVMHSATKFLGGHSDVLAGMLVTPRLDDAWAALAALRREEGACLGPMDAYLVLRGMRTLFARVERSSRTAQSLAHRLAAIPGVTVRYPGLPDHPGHAIAARQMQRGFGSMLSIQVGGGSERARAVVGRLAVWVSATSLGGVESLIEHRYTVEGPTTPTPPDLLRLSVGLEHEDDLFDDLQAALR